MYHYPTKQILLEAVIEDIEQSSLDSLLQFFSHLLKVKYYRNQQTGGDSWSLC